MKRITMGILAHVDAGKTTLSEGLSYISGQIRKMGRVDNKDSFLDTDELERKKGITIFSKQAILTGDGYSITLLDTPGHTDFFAEAERTVSVFDYALLVISGTEGIQSHTRTLWELLYKKNIPVFVFINKSDLTGFSLENTISELNEEFGGGFFDFSCDSSEEFFENAALCDEDLMTEFLEKGAVSEESIQKAVKLRKIFPCFSGSALKMEGVEDFFKGFLKYTVSFSPLPAFGARVFKIKEDEKGNRLTFIKVTGGSLKVKDIINDEKINEIRIYSSDKYKTSSEVLPGEVCAVLGPKSTYSGQGLGADSFEDKLTAQPVFNYKLNYPSGIDIPKFVAGLKKLQEEETKLNITWNEAKSEIGISLMGEIQLEVLTDLIYKKLGVLVTFSRGGVIYKETILNTVEGVGHYEPLRHYAEVHLLLEPLPEGSGMQFECDVSEDNLAKNWQRLILNHLMEKAHKGVLTGSPVTDIKITLKAGRAHLKHTEGGDFRQATYRAVRQGLMNAESVLLEPYYRFVIDAPGENTGRIMTDLDRMEAKVEMPYTKGSFTRISGEAPASLITAYQSDLIALSGGQGKMSTRFSAYRPCKNQDKIIEEIGYNPESDTENTPDSVFCSHGAGFTVKWNEVPEYMHLESILKPKPKEEVREKKTKFFATDEELLKIFENTYGKVKQTRVYDAMHTKKEPVTVKETKVKIKTYDKEYLLIDGYNIIFAWEDLSKTARDSLENARKALIDRLETYRIFKKYEIIVVFDAYKVKGNPGEKEIINGINIVYTREAQTADAYIEKTAAQLSKNYRVTVATSDALEQMIIFGGGALRMSARTLLSDVEIVEETVRKMLEENSVDIKNSDFYKSFSDI